MLFALPAAAQAATLELSPASNSIQAGQNITLTITAQSAEAINAVTSSLSFPADLLSVASVSKAGSGLTLWVQEPKYSNAAGTIDFSGIVPDPGISGRTRILVVQFHAKKTGTASVRFVSAAALANDGQGTNVLSGTVPATIVVTPASAPAVPAVKETPALAAQEAPVAVASFEPPVITQYQTVAKEYGPVTVSGTSKYAGASVSVYFVSGDTKVKGTTSVDPSGRFKYVQTDGLPEGDYSIYATVQDWNSSSKNSNTVYMEVMSVNRVVILGFSIPVWFLMALISVLFGSLLLIGLHAHVRINRLMHHIVLHHHKKPF